MNNNIPTHLLTLANARDHIQKLESQITQLQAANASLKAQLPKQDSSATKAVTETSSKASPYQRHLNVSNLYTPEETAAYKEGIIQAEKQLERAKDALRSAGSLEQQYQALALVTKARINLEEKKRPPIPQSRLKA
ncbi:MAG: hypothetical protein ACP5I4_09475 [Oceanipulchritudo sp.]